MTSCGIICQSVRGFAANLGGDKGIENLRHWVLDVTFSVDD